MAAGITAAEVSSCRDRRGFFLLPWRIYQGDGSWVPPLLLQVKESLDTRKNPFYRYSKLKLFLARKDGMPAGRVAAIVNSAHNEFHGEKAGFFGFFECINDPAVAAAVLTPAREWLAAQGMSVFRGPANPSTNHDCGMLVNAFDLAPQVMMPYNPAYYPALLEACGLRPVKDLLAYRISADAFTPELCKLADHLERRSGFVVRPIDMKHFEREAQLIREVYNSAWERNWGFVPVDDVEFTYLAHQMKTILEPSLALIGFVHDRPAGFSLSLPNVNEALARINGRLFPFGFFRLMMAMKRIGSARNLLMGVIPECRKLGLDIVLYRHTIDAAKRLGYTWGELSWILEENADMRRVLEKIGASAYKTYRFFEMPTRGMKR